MADRFCQRPRASLSAGSPEKRRDGLLSKAPCVPFQQAVLWSGGTTTTFLLVHLSKGANLSQRAQLLCQMFNFHPVLELCLLQNWIVCTWQAVFFPLWLHSFLRKTPKEFMGSQGRRNGNGIHITSAFFKEIKSDSESPELPGWGSGLRTSWLPDS